MEQFKRFYPSSLTKLETNNLVKHIVKIFKCSDQEVISKLNEQNEIWRNDLYQVVVRRNKTIYDAKEIGMTHLSIKRIDNGSIHNWRDLQQIKNMIMNEDCVGVEIYPNENNLVDTANQYHLWVFDDPTFRLPFGFNDGRRVSYETPKGTGVNQQPFNNN
jgi:hypothetical protein